MRFQIGQTIFGVHFGYGAHIPRTYGFYMQPMLWDNVEPDDINFVCLTVTEHHKVPDSNDPKGELNCDGYLLKAENSKVFANQYPTASYGQVSDEGNRRFSVHIKEAGELNKMQKEDQKAIFEYHSLSDILEKIQRGIKDLGEIPETAERYLVCKEKRELLIKFYDRVVREFHEKYPDYRLNLAWKPPFKKSVLIWPDVTFYKRIPVKKADEMSKEDILKDFNSDGRFEVEYANGEGRLVIEKAEGTYYIDSKMTDVNTINVFYAEKSEEDGKPVFYVHQTEYFPRSWAETAVECFIKRLQDGGIKAVNMGMSIEAVAAKDKELEGLQQVRS